MCVVIPCGRSCRDRADARRCTSHRIEGFKSVEEPRPDIGVVIAGFRAPHNVAAALTQQSYDGGGVGRDGAESLNVCKGFFVAERNVDAARRW